ncbi:hypothetical protein SAMN04487948_1081 [Halogranum amylolyticum]|uniref:Uncharacterized protein n=1 Tax=Halogranum amylolyticum TaxID=660520 RepID=A0A1H8TPN8_9EURY|nr:hypothetical protein [Halogranum amylolyticum]SEO92428.1 hypothetical protein SAMN04487948_1081 [Halogranum amylolyticum]
MTDRPNALLTKKQREKLREASEDSEHSRQYRQRIRERTQNGTIDLGMLFEHMELRDIKQVFGPDVSHLNELNNAVEDIRSLLSGYGSKRSLRNQVDELEMLAENYSDDFRQTSQFEEANQSDDWYDFQQESHEQHQNQLESIQQSAVEILDVYGEWLENLEQAQSNLEQLAESDQFDSKYQNRIANVIDELEGLHQQTSSDREELKEVVDEINYQTRRSESVPPELIDDLTSSLQTVKRSRTHVWSELSELDSQIQMDLGQSNFEQDLRDDVVSALAFYLRVSEVLDTSAEDLIEDALVRTYEQEHPDDVVGHVTVDVAVDDRTKAVKQGSRKLTEGDTRLCSTELRAIAETKPSLLSTMQRQCAFTTREFREAVIENSGQLEKGLEIVDANPDAPGDTVVPDLVAKDTDGNLVLIELNRWASIEQRPESTINRVRELINQYGGEDRVRAFIVVPHFELEERDEETSLHKVLSPEGPIELKSVALV